MSTIIHSGVRKNPVKDLWPNTAKLSINEPQVGGSRQDLTPLNTFYGAFLGKRAG